MVTGDRLPGPTDYLFEWIVWLTGDEQATFAREYERLRDEGSGAELSRLLVSWHNRAMQRKARRRRLEREDES